MDSELKKLLEDNLVLNKENNDLLVKIYKAEKLRQIMGIARIVLIFGFAIGAFYFLETIFDNVFSIYGISFSSIEDLFK